MKVVLSLFMLLMRPACAGQFMGMEEPDKDGAIVYYYRPWKYTGAALSLDIMEDGVPVAELGVNEYKVHRTNAGKKTASTESGGAYDYVPFTAEKGKSYFVRAERTWEFTGILGGVQIDLVPQEKALKEIQKCGKVE